MQRHANEATTKSVAAEQSSVCKCKTPGKSPEDACMVHDCVHIVWQQAAPVESGPARSQGLDRWPRSDVAAKKSRRGLRAGWTESGLGLEAQYFAHTCHSCYRCRGVRKFDTCSLRWICMFLFAGLWHNTRRAPTLTHEYTLHPSIKNIVGAEGQGQSGVQALLHSRRCFMVSSTNRLHTLTCLHAQTCVHAWLCQITSTWRSAIRCVHAGCDGCVDTSPSFHQEALLDRCVRGTCVPKGRALV